ncbi:MAG: hypothetical protein ACI8S6_000036 [Myxococcota bacterium]
MKRLITTLGLLALSVPALAARMPMDPQNKAHMGASVVDLEAIGVTGGLDSRLTRFVYIDISGLVSATETDLTEPTDPDATITDYVKTRHALWVAPGIRVPHRYGEGLKWDVFFRGGFGVVWSQDLSADGLYLTNPAGLGGMDLVLRKDAIGVRASGKVFAYRALPTIAFTDSWGADELGVLGSQLALEAIYQW